MRRLVRGALVALALLLLHAAPALAAAPLNDDFDGATVVSALPFTDTEDVSGATRAADDPYTSGWPNVWYRFTPARNTSLELDTAGSNTDTSICVYTGTRGSLAQVACSPDGFYSHFFASLQAGVTYHIMVDITSGCCGQALTLTLTDRTVANDDFDAAQQIDALPYEDTRDVLQATVAPDDPWCLQNSNNTVWYRYTPAADVTVAADTAGSDYDTRLCVYYGSRGALNEVASNDDTGTLFAALAVNLQAGTTYWFMVATNQPGASNLHLTLQQADPLPTVANDEFDAATPIDGTPFSDTLDASTATAAADDPTDCYGSHGSVWYAFTPSVSGTATISTAGSDYDTALGVYTGSRGTLAQVACNNDSDPTLTSQVSFQAVAGQTYYLLAVAAWSLAPRTLQLSVSLRPPPLTLRLAYDAQAAVDEQTGTALVTGTITCSRNVKPTITVNVGQQLGSSAARTGSGRGTVSCPAQTPTRFAISVASTSSPGLSDGPASVKLLATGCDPSGCAKASAGGELLLVKKLK
jgi:hypothetical protein